MSKRRELIEKIKLQGLPSDLWQSRKQLPVVSLEDFFTGNNDSGSIGCNLASPPGPAFFFQALSEIRSRPDVQDVLVEIYEVEEEDETMWPFSERVYLVTTATSEQVTDWLEQLQPSGISEGWAFGQPSGVPALPPDMKVYGVWWD